MTSLLRALVAVPMASAASRITTSWPRRASERATARPTTPAPITMLSRVCMSGAALQNGSVGPLAIAAAT